MFPVVFKDLLLQEDFQVFSYTIEPAIASGARGCGALEAVRTERQRVEFALYAHSAHLFPNSDRIHRGPEVGVSVYHQHWRRIKIEGEFGSEVQAVVVAAGGVVLIEAVAEHVRGVYSDAPLHLAGDFVYVVYRLIRLMAG